MVSMMENKFNYKLTYKLNQNFEAGIDYINDFCAKHKGSKILVEVQNTKGITSSMLRRLNEDVSIRIAGGYDEEKVKLHKDEEHGGETGEYYTTAVIYTRNETINIVKEIEKIESGINKNWSEFQKLIYVYDALKKSIMYDPKYKNQPSSEIRSLRGLVTKKTVCAGYSLILKEFMDRQGIKCEYVEGWSPRAGHAWNIVDIDGKKYPIDLTWDNRMFRTGNLKSFDYLGQNIEEFSKNHTPNSNEPTQNYKKTLSEIDPELIRKAYVNMGLGRTKDYSRTTYKAKRKDGSRFIIAQVGNNIIDNKSYYRYYYAEILKDGKIQSPLVLYSDTNVTSLVYGRKHGKNYPKSYFESVADILFSKGNIADSLKKGTNYIGKVNKNKKGEKFELATSYKEIPKDEEICKLFKYPTARFRRSDGSVFVVQQMLMAPRKTKGINVMQYDIFEMVNENGKEVLKKNVVFTESNLLKFYNQDMIDHFLSRSRLDKLFAETGGYIGSYASNGKTINHPELIDYFKISKSIDINSSEKVKQQTNVPKFKIPTFSELKQLATKYEVLYGPKIEIRDIKTKQLQTDKSVIDRAVFANIWLSSAGVNKVAGESRQGITYAFNEQAEILYNTICNQLLTSCKNNGVIDTVKILNDVVNDDRNRNKYKTQITANLFGTEYTTKMINKLFLQSLGISEQKKEPVCLHPVYYDQYITYDTKNSYLKSI